jgi:hypothetical protein
MKTLSIFGILFSLICLGCSIFMMNAECNCPPSENASLFYNNTEPVGAFGSGLINLFVSIFFLTFSIITAVIFFGSKKGTATTNWQAANMPQQQPQQPQANYNWQPANFPPPSQNQQWTPPPPPQTPPANPQWTPQTPPPPPQNQQWNQPPPPPGWQQPPTNDDLNRWAPKRDNPPNNTPPAN